MAEVSAAQAESARKIERCILHALAERGQVHVAQAMGTSESTVSRLKDGHIKQTADLLAALALKVVPADYRCLDPKKAEAMVTLFESAMRTATPAQLLMGDEA